MLALQWKFCTIMVESDTFPIHFPAIGFMAIVAIGFETITMRRFLGQQTN
jgi:hypothetical protein